MSNHDRKVKNMPNFDELVRQKQCLPYHTCAKYHTLGKTYQTNTSLYSGIYWYYETDEFIIDIHDLEIKKNQKITFNGEELRPYFFITSTYFIAGKRIPLTLNEKESPLETKKSRILITDTFTHQLDYTLQKDTHILSVGISFKEAMIERVLTKKLAIPKTEVKTIFLSTKETISETICHLANEIVHCQMENGAAELFFEAKANEWFSLTLDAYLKNQKSLPKATDITAIEQVASYINEYYAQAITQKDLEQIAMMSGTKLKNTFKAHYHMTITEYLQRKRISIAEHLIVTTNLDIQTIAKKVGYHSPSRFSTLFKRYRGISPKSIKLFRHPFS